MPSNLEDFINEHAKAASEIPPTYAADCQVSDVMRRLFECAQEENSKVVAVNPWFIAESARMRETVHAVSIEAKPWWKFWREARVLVVADRNINTTFFVSRRVAEDIFGWRQDDESSK